MSETNDERYAELRLILDEVYHHCAHDKGAERHDPARQEWSDQQIIQLNKWIGTEHGCLFQAAKKTIESAGLPYAQARRELIGAIGYIAGALKLLDELYPTDAALRRNYQTPKTQPAEGERTTMNERFIRRLDDHGQTRSESFLNGQAPAWVCYDADRWPEQLRPALDDAADTAIATNSQELRVFSYRRGPARICGQLVDLCDIDDLAVHLGDGAMSASAITIADKTALAIQDADGRCAVMVVMSLRDEAAHVLDFDHRAGIQGRCPGFGPVTALQFFDDEGNGPDMIEVALTGVDVVNKQDERMLPRRVQMSLPDTILKGGGYMGVEQLRALRDQVAQALAWAEAGQDVVRGTGKAEA